MVIHPDSLSLTVDSILDDQFHGRPFRAKDAKASAQWIASRQGLDGAYGGTFAGFEKERKDGVLLFTGERVTAASARHILGEESCRALRFLAVRDAAVQNALDRADQGLRACIERYARDSKKDNPGLFCCGKCSVGMWRNLLSGGLDRQAERLDRGVRVLRSRRDGAGGWAAFPFWYSVLVLQELDTREARQELAYARPKLERTSTRGAFGVRRKRLSELAIQKAG